MANFKLHSGDLINHQYRIVKFLDQGGFSQTFLAVDERQSHHPLCVIKQFHPRSSNLHQLQKATQLFEQESIQLKNLGKHPQIAEFWNYFKLDQNQYLVQEWIEGQNLGKILETEPAFQESQIRDFLTNILPVLEYIHSHHVIHRDIKPKNIIQKPNGEYVIVDFGAAKHATESALLQTGTLIGTPEYVAPEQLRGKATFASDLYSLGVTCLHLLTQVSPFELFDTSENQWVWRHYIINNPVSEDFGKILDKLVEHATRQRYQSAAEVLQALNPQKQFSKLRFSSSSVQQQQINTNFIQKNSETLMFRPWGRPQTLTHHSSSISGVAISPDNEILASSSFDGTMKLWNLQTGALLQDSIALSSPILTLAFSPNYQYLACGSGDGIIRIWNFPSGIQNQMLIAHPTLTISLSLVFSPDSQWLATSSDDGQLKIWQIETGECLKTLTHSRGINTIAFSLDHHYLAFGSSDNIVYLWQINPWQKIRQFEGHSRDINTVSFSDDGEMIASGSSDRTLKLWQTTGELLRTWQGHSDWVKTLTFCSMYPQSDTPILVSGSADKTIKIWHLNQEYPLQTLVGHSKDINAIAVSSDGKTLVSGSRDSTLKIWRRS